MVSIVLNRAQRAALNKLKSELCKVRCSFAYIFQFLNIKVMEQKNITNGTACFP